jgi:hypothetical protein
MPVKRVGLSNRTKRWLEIAHEENVIWSGHYARDFRSEAALRTELKRVKKEHPNGIVTLTTFEEHFGFPVGTLNNAKRAGLLPKPIMVTNTTIAYDYKELFESLSTPEAAFSLLHAQKTSKNPRMGTDQKRERLLFALKKHGFVK